MKTKQMPPFGLRLPDDLKDWVKEKAEEQGRSMNNFIVRQLESQKAEEATAQK